MPTPRHNRLMDEFAIVFDDQARLWLNAALGPFISILTNRSDRRKITVESGT